MQETIGKWYEAHEQEVFDLSRKIWEYAEPSMQEFQSTQAIAEFLRKEGFQVETKQVQNHEGPHNAIIARWGEGKPVIGFLGEYDALPELGQEAVPYYAPIKGHGHGCGHNLNGVGNASAAAALKAAMEAENRKGTVLFIGTPAEETGQGKVYLARDGYFNEMDVALEWHPGGGIMEFGECEFTANTAMVFKFTGKTAHAAARPYDGRSALDAAELMSVGTQYLREHLPANCFIHHVYREAGGAPNIVPEYAEIYFFIRSRDDYNEQLVERVKRIAKGAAMMTETSVKTEMISSCHAFTYNRALDYHLYEAATKIPPLTYTPEEYAFAREIYRNSTGQEAPKEDTAVLPTEIRRPSGKIRQGQGSSDIGEVAYICPAVHMTGGGAVTGLSGHHWSITAASGMSIGQKATVFGGKILAQFGYDAVTDPSIIEECWKEFHENRKVPYKCRLVEGDQEIIIKE